MDKLEQRLKQDAAAIDATVTTDLRARIDASIAPVPREQPPQHRGRFPLWLALPAAAVLAAIVLWMPRFNEPERDQQFTATPSYEAEQALPFDLQVQPVALTEPLEHELVSLRSDLQRVRIAIEQELRSTL